MEETDAPNRPNVHITEKYRVGDRQLLRPVTPEICDFCGDGSPAWDYDCADFVIDGLWASAGGWAACEQCSTYIETGEWARIVTRATFGLPDDIGKAMMVKNLPLLHEKFREKRIGGRTPHVEGELWTHLTTP